MTALIAPEWSLLDRAALGWFLLSWLGYGPFIQHLRSPHGRPDEAIGRGTVLQGAA